MQTSISKIFSTINTFYLLILLLTTLLLLSIGSEYSSFSKLKNLAKEQQLAASVYTLGREDLDLSNIQFRGKNTQLKHSAEELFTLYELDYVNKFVTAGSYKNEITKLLYTIKDFNSASENWFTQKNVSEQELQNYKNEFDQNYHLLLTQIQKMVSANISFEERRFQLQAALVLALLLLILIAMSSNNKGLKKIKNDLLTLQNYDGDEAKTFLTLEAENIAKRLGRTSKATPSGPNPAYLDTLTGINNNKGFMHELSDKKSQKLGNYTALCVFSVDRLNELEMQYPQEFTDAILKKVSFMLSLYRQHNDVIGRLDHNQFAILLSRQDKTSAVNDAELIRKSIEESPFKSPDGHSVDITMSGGFVQKMSTQPLTEVMTKATKVLAMSVQHGGNRIAQLRDKSTALK